MSGRGYHDMGGLPAGRIERTEQDEAAHPYADWERRVDAMTVLLVKKAVLCLDERRRHIESLPPQHYDSMRYYERWLYALGQSLLQRGVITTEELGRKMEEICSRNRNS